MPPPRNEGGVRGLRLFFADIIEPTADQMAKEYIEERNGGYYVAGTGVSLDSLVQCFADGLSPETILGEFETRPKLTPTGSARNSGLRRCGGPPSLFRRDCAAGWMPLARSFVPAVRIR